MPQLKANRNCTLPGITESSCVQNLLDNESGKTLFYGQGDNEQALDTKGASDGEAGKTTTLAQLLSKFSIKHVDLLSADCQGCELRALQGLNMDAVDVSVVNVEINADFCKIKDLLAARGYVGIHIDNSYDVAFLSKKMVGALASAPQPPNPLRPPLVNYRRVVDVLKSCGQNMWFHGSSWPPSTNSSA